MSFIITKQGKFQRSNIGRFENLQIWDTLEALSDAVCNALHYKMNVTEFITSICEIHLYYGTCTSYEDKGNFH